MVRGTASSTWCRRSDITRLQHVIVYLIRSGCLVLGTILIWILPMIIGSTPTCILCVHSLMSSKLLIVSLVVLSVLCRHHWRIQLTLRSASIVVLVRSAHHWRFARGEYIWEDLLGARDAIRKILMGDRGVCSHEFILLIVCIFSASTRLVLRLN